MADVISYTFKIDIATKNPTPDLNKLITDISDTVENWAKKNNSKDTDFDVKWKFYDISDKSFDKLETHREREQRQKAEAKTEAS